MAETVKTTYGEFDIYGAEGSRERQYQEVGLRAFGVIYPELIQLGFVEAPKERGFGVGTVTRCFPVYAHKDY